jgi:hypothetical protein
MTDAELDAIEATIGKFPIAYQNMKDLMALVAEVRRLRAENSELRDLADAWARDWSGTVRPMAVEKEETDR